MPGGLQLQRRCNYRRHLRKEGWRVMPVPCNHPSAYPLALTLVSEIEAIAGELRSAHHDLAQRLTDSTISLAINIASEEYVVASCSGTIASATLDIALSMQAISAETHARIGKLLKQIM